MNIKLPILKAYNAITLHSSTSFISSTPVIENELRNTYQISNAITPKLFLIRH